MSKEQVASKQPEPLPGLNWASIDIEQLRGEGLSFPISIEILISPAFTLFTLGTANNFIHYFQDSFLDPEGDGFPIRLKNEVTVDDEVILIHPGDIVLALTYIDETESIVVFDPTPSMH